MSEIRPGASQVELDVPSWRADPFKQRETPPAMLDSDFTTFITVRFVGVIYSLGLLALVIAAIPAFMQARGLPEQLGVVAAVPIAGVLWRMLLEGVVVVFRIAENTSELVELRKRRVRRD